MKIVVCAKQVPDTTEVKLDPKTNTLIRDGVPSIINPDDKSGIEAALKIKEQVGGTVTVVCMGPPQADVAIREALAMGCDDGVLISGREFGGSDTLATSTIIAAGLKTLDYDLIITGRQAIDGDTAQVGPQIAEKLHLPQVTYAADIQKDGDTITVKRMLEDGYMTIKVKTPCLITCIKELNTPRYMSVGGVFEAYSKPLTTLGYEDLKDDPLIDATTIGLKGSPTNIFKSFTPPQKGVGMMLEGDGKETCEKLASILAEKHII